jgi:hypothetical protein
MADTTETLIFELKINDSTGGKPPAEQKKEVDALAGSILGLQQANKKLRDERKLLDTTTEAGSARIKQLNAEIDKNDAAIKKNSSSLEKQRLNVGNYTGALDKLIPGLGATVNGIAGMTKASLAFIATPIGIVIAALGLAIAAVTKYLTGSEEGMDKFAKISAQVSAVVGVLVDRVIELGGALVAFLTGDFEGGLNKLSGAFAGVGDEIEREIELAGQLADMLDQLEERELRYGLAVSETANEIKKLIIEAKNRQATEEERIAKLEEATKKEIALNEQIKAIQEDKILAAALQVQADFSALESQRKVGESAIDFAKRIVANEDIVFDRRKELADLIISYNQSQGESLNLQEKISNQTDALNEKLDARIEKEKALNDEVARYLEVFQAKLDADQIAFEKEQVADEERATMAQRFRDDLGLNQQVVLDTNAAITASNKAKADSDAKFNKASNDIKKKQDTDYLTTFAKLSAEGAALFKQNTIAFKVLATGRAIANTFLGVTEILKTPSVLPEPAATIARVLSIATAVGSGLKAVAEINKISFARGGRADKRGVFEGPSHAGGGIDYVRSDGKHAINVEGDEAFFVLKKSATREIGALSGLNQKHGGASFGHYPSIQKNFALGGNIPTTRQTQGLSVLDVQNIVMSMPRPVVIVEDINTGQANRAEVVDKANVL